MTRNPSLNLLILVVLVTVSLVGLTYMNYQFSMQNPGGNDFLARWMGANKWLQEGLSPYDERVSLATQEMIYGRAADVSAGEDKSHFVFPLYSMLFFGPFGFLEYTLARALWMTLLEVSAIALVGVSLRLADWRLSLRMTAVLTLFSLFGYYGARNVILGEFAILNAVLALLAVYWVVQKQDTAAGILLALSTIEPQMVVLLVLFVLLWAYSVRRFRIIVAFFVTLVLLIVVSLALVPDWPLGMLRQIIDYPNYTMTLSPLAIIANMSPGIQPLFGQVLHVVAFIYLLGQWVAAWGKDERWFLWTALMSIVITHLAINRTTTTNFVIMLPALFLLFRIIEQRWRGPGRAFNLILILALLFGLWWMFLSTVDGNSESLLMFLPLPILSLLGLIWLRWWALRPPRLYLEDIADQFG